MDFLLEMTPGSGWLAREHDRVVFIPTAEPVDVAHDVIEPLLLPRDTDTSFSTFQTWLDTERPLPPLLLVGLGSTPARIMAHGIDRVRTSEPGKDHTTELALATLVEPVPLTGVTRLGVNDDADEPSGMLIEGVIRAGGFRVNFHQNTTARTSQEVAANPIPRVLQLHLDSYSVEVGDGMVLGRWPYKHPAFDPNLEPLILADPAVSRLHAEVVPAAGGATITDKASHNGTWIRRATTNEREQLPPETPTPLHDGDQILIGDTVIRFGGQAT